MLASLMNAQQDPQFTQWFMDPVVSNIAAAGQSNLTNISAIYRQQWVSMDGRPETTLINFDIKIFIPYFSILFTFSLVKSLFELIKKYLYYEN